MQRSRLGTSERRHERRHGAYRRNSEPLPLIERVRTPKFRTARFFIMSACADGAPVDSRAVYAAWERAGHDRHTLHVARWRMAKRGELVHEMTHGPTMQRGVSNLPRSKGRVTRSLIWRGSQTVWMLTERGLAAFEALLDRYGAGAGPSKDFVGTQGQAAPYSPSGKGALRPCSGAGGDISRGTSTEKGGTRPIVPSEKQQPAREHWPYTDEHERPVWKTFAGGVQRLVIIDPDAPHGYRDYRGQPPTGGRSTVPRDWF